MDDLKKLIRNAGLPKPGILFYDITTLLKDRAGLRGVIDRLKETYDTPVWTWSSASKPPGSIFASALATPWRGLRAVRKPKKLPGERSA